MGRKKKETTVTLKILTTGGEVYTKSISAKDADLLARGAVGFVEIAATGIVYEIVEVVKMSYGLFLETGEEAERDTVTV